MYAVVRSGGKQYRVEEGSVLSVGKVAGNAGDTITLDQILFVADGEAIVGEMPRLLYVSWNSVEPK